MSAPNYRTDQSPFPDAGVIVDLSDRVDALLGYQDLSDTLSAEEETKLVQYIKAMMQMSYDRVSRRYSHWREADRAHDVWVPPDATKFREKVVIADTRAIADTVLTYLMAALAGRNPMFQLEGLNRKSRRAAAVLERVLHMQLRRGAGEARIAQLLLDCVRYGFSPTKLHWDAKRNSNVLVNFDPRRCFPDPRVNWGDWENASFIGFVSTASFNSLFSSGLYPKLKKYPALRYKLASPMAGWDCHQFAKEEGRGYNIDPLQPADRGETQEYFSLGDARVVDEVWLRVCGYEIGIPQLDQVWMVATILDEQVCIRLQLNPYGAHFPCVIGGLYNDSGKTFSQSLYDLLLPLHDIATWLLRSRVDNVQAALNNLIFADPTQIVIPDLIDRNPWGVVRTMPGVKPGEGVFIAQVPDVTRGHWNDIAALSDLKQRVSAASDAQQGMPTADGIRTATEIQRLTQLGSQRLGVLSRVLSATTIRPLVGQMVGNIQDAINYSGSVKIDPYSLPSLLSDAVKDDYLDFQVGDLQGEIDYLIVDGTLPVEPTRNAETWMNMLQVLNQTGLLMEYKGGLIAEEAIRSMGISDLDRFRVSKQEQQQPTPAQQMMLMEKMRGANVMPADQVQREAERGNLVPMRQR